MLARTPMSDDRMEYDRLVQEALRGVVRQILERAGGPEGLPPPHHLFLTFKTRYPGVGLPERLLEQYPDEMTIVLQTHYWDLAVDPEKFEVTLSFQQQLERLTIPLKAVSQIVDPSVPFGLRLEVPWPKDLPEPAEGEGASVDELPSLEGASENVVSLASFRKK